MITAPRAPGSFAVRIGITARSSARHGAFETLQRMDRFGVSSSGSPIGTMFPYRPGSLICIRVLCSAADGGEDDDLRTSGVGRVSQSCPSFGSPQKYPTIRMTIQKSTTQRSFGAFALVIMSRPSSGLVL